MTNLTFVSDPWSGSHPEFTHCRYIAHNDVLPSFLLTNEEHCQKYGYPSVRDIIEGYLFNLGNVEEEDHSNETMVLHDFTQVTFEFGPIEPINHEKD